MRERFLFWLRSKASPVPNPKQPVQTTFGVLFHHLLTPLVLKLRLFRFVKRLIFLLSLLVYSGFAETYANSHFKLLLVSLFWLTFCEFVASVCP